MKRFFGGGHMAWIGRGVELLTPDVIAAALAPIVASLAPLTGGLTAILAGLASTVVGSNFQAGATVTVGGLPAIAVVIDDMHVAIVLPLTLSLGVKDVIVTNPDGMSSGLTGVGKFTVTL